jgi:hypothetical protein
VRRRRRTPGEIRRRRLEEEHRYKLALVREFVARHGWSKVRADTVFRGVNLFSWVRGRRIAYLDGTIDDFIVPLLEAIPGWSWDPRRDRHRRNIDNLRAFVRRHGWDAISRSTVLDGVNMVQWCANRRVEYHRDVLMPWIVAALEAIPGWTWDPYAAHAAERVRALRAYAAEHGLARLRQHTVARDGSPIGRWAHRARTQYRGGRAPLELVRELESIPGWTWEPGIDRQRRKLELLRRFVARKGWAALRPSTVFDGEKLGEWMVNCRQRRRIDGLGAWLQRELEAIPGWSWRPRSRRPR